jgi:hypothetical protein
MFEDTCAANAGITSKRAKSPNCLRIGARMSRWASEPRAGGSGGPAQQYDRPAEKAIQQVVVTIAGNIRTGPVDVPTGDCGDWKMPEGCGSSRKACIAQPIRRQSKLVHQTGRRHRRRQTKTPSRRLTT